MTISIQQLFALHIKRILLALAGTFLLCSMAPAAQITLAWDKVNDSTIVGYKIYYGTQSAKYTASVDAGSALQYTISGLAYDTTYYFSAKSYNSTGEKSSFANEVSRKIQSPNSAPKTPVLTSGSSSSSVNTTFSCTATATDPDGDALKYRFNWDDGTVSSWGSSSQSHIWKNPSEYCVKGQAKDGDGALSSWSACFSVTVTSTASSTGTTSVGGSSGGVTASTDTSGGGAVKLWLEAEDGDITEPMEIADDTDTAGGLYIDVPNKRQVYQNPDFSAGYAEFVFQAPKAGYYLIWGRVLAPSWGDDSFFVSMDDAAFIRWNLTVGNAWHWETVSNASGPWKVYLAAGTHTFTMLCREDGTNIDKILITSDTAYTPQGQGGEQSGSATSSDTTTGAESTGSGASIAIEAEKGVRNGSMATATAADASAGQYVWGPDGSGNAFTPDPKAGSVTFSFTVPQTGDYIAWGRVLSSNYANDSFYAAMDGGSPFRWNTKVTKSWTWNQVAPAGETDPMVWRLSAGTHKLVLMLREDGTKLDKIIITSDQNAKPAD